MRDLVCVVADKCIEAILHGLLNHRTDALRIHRIQSDVFVHPRRDPGCYNEGPEFLGTFHRSYLHGLLVFDCKWDGAPFRDSRQLEGDVRGRFAATGLGDWAEVVAVEPEIEAWVWSESPHLAKALGWKGEQPVRQWLEAMTLWATGHAKPSDPKAALEAVLRHVRRPLSSSIFSYIARTVSVERCADPGFIRLKELLAAWFGV